jgi:hypothetical protein
MLTPAARAVIQDPFDRVHTNARLLEGSRGPSPQVMWSEIDTRRLAKPPYRSTDVSEAPPAPNSSEYPRRVARGRQPPLENLLDHASEGQHVIPTILGFQKRKPLFRPLHVAPPQTQGFAYATTRKGQE